MPSLSESCPTLMPMLPLRSSLFWKYVSPACVLFFSPRLEVCGMRLKDFSHTVALLCEVENTSGADACLFHSAAALSLRFILPCTAHCALVTHSFLPPPSHLQNGWSQRPRWWFPWVLTSATRHKQPTSSCGKTTWHQSGCFFSP